MTTGEQALPQPVEERPPENGFAALRNEAALQSLRWVCLLQAGFYLWDFLEYGRVYLSATHRLYMGPEPWYAEFFQIGMVLTLPIAVLTIAAFFAIRHWRAARRSLVSALFCASVYMAVVYLMAAYPVYVLTVARIPWSFESVARIGFVAGLGLPNVLYSGYMARLAWQSGLSRRCLVDPELPATLSPLVHMIAYLAISMCTRFLIGI